MKDYSATPMKLREKRMARLALIPEEKRPRCCVCKELIPYDGKVEIKRFMLRNVCSIYIDPKEIKCFSVKAKAANAARPKVQSKSLVSPCPHKKKTAPPEEKKATRTQEEIDQLNYEQRKINIAVHSRVMEQCGYVTLPARSLTQEEIARLAPTLTPPGNVKRAYNPHFRQEQSRRGVEL